MKIKKLELYTSNLDTQIDFYANILGLDIIKNSEDTVEFQIGNSILRFVQNDNFKPYHYAINIPSNMEQEALEWLKQRVDILCYDGNEIQYFDFWNAYAIYFYDKDKNIGEFIARKELDINSSKPFSQASLLGISEIGIPTRDVKSEFELLNDVSAIPIHSGNLKRFCAVGDEEGLFIIINKNLKKEWFPTKDIPLSADFKIEFSTNGNTFYFEYKNEQLKESVR